MPDCDSFLLIIYMYIRMHTLYIIYIYKYIIFISVVKRNPLFLHEIEWKNKVFRFTISNMCIFML